MGFDHSLEPKPCTRSFVYPSATHTRFEHSLGVAHKAHELAYQIYQGQGAELGITPADVRTVELAGEPIP